MTTREVEFCGIGKLVSESYGVGEEFGGFDTAGG